MRVNDMLIPEERKQRIVARSALIADMQTHGAVTTPVEYLQIPILLVMHQTDEQLRDSHSRLMRTRRRGIRFDLNGRVFMLTRKAAIAVVREEIASRLKMANVELSGPEDSLHR